MKPESNQAAELEAAKARENLHATAAAELLPQLRQYFGAERWRRLLKQMAARSMNEDRLTRHIVSTRGAQCAGNDAAWTVQAAHHALVLCGSLPGPDDHERLKDALQPVSSPAEAPVKEPPSPAPKKKEKSA